MKRALRKFFFAPLTFVRWLGMDLPKFWAAVAYILAALVVFALVAAALWAVGFLILTSFVRLFRLDVPTDFDHCMYTLGVLWTLRWVLSAAAGKSVVEVKGDDDEKL